MKFLRVCLLWSILKQIKGGSLFCVLQLFPMSLLACLGNDASAIRDMYVARLQAITEVSQVM